MNRIVPVDRTAIVEAAEEETRQASRPLFVLGAIGCLSLLAGDLVAFATAAVVLALAALLRYKQSRTAALLICFAWSALLISFVITRGGLHTWPEVFRALFFVVAIVSAGLAVRATFRYHRAVGVSAPT
jgi:hypothetical protein